MNIELKKIYKQIKKHIEICKNYTFEEGSQLFGECILKLIEKVDHEVLLTTID